MNKFLLLTPVVGILCGLALAEDVSAPAKRRAVEDRVAIVGTIVDLGSALDALGADAQGALFADGALGLRLSDGTLWTFVDNARGHGVIHNARLRGKDVTVFGWKFPSAQYVEVQKYQVREGDHWTAYDYCRDCGWRPGDFGDTELCEECADER